MWNLQYTGAPLSLIILNVWLPYPFMKRYPSGVPRSEKRKDTWCVVSGRSEMKSQNMSASFRFVFGFRFCVWMKLGNCEKM